MVTAHGDLVIDFSDTRLRDITRRLRDEAVSDATAREELGVKDNAG
jgi:hypothetical protein